MKNLIIPILLVSLAISVFCTAPEEITSAATSSFEQVQTHVQEEWKNIRVAIATELLEVIDTNGDLSDSEIDPQLYPDVK